MQSSALIDSLEIACSPRVSETKLKQSQTDNREAETSACMSYGGSFILSNNSLQVESDLTAHRSRRARFRSSINCAFLHFTRRASSTYPTCPLIPVGCTVLLVCCKTCRVYCLGGKYPLDARHGISFRNKYYYSRILECYLPLNTLDTLALRSLYQRALIRARLRMKPHSSSLLFG